jgi:acyl carrier protein
MSVQQRLEAVFKDVFNDQGIALADATTAADIPGWDSVAHITLMFGIEQEFGVQFVGNQLAEFETIGALRTYLESRVV